MESKLVIYNTLTRQKERFEPLHAPNVGMYVCGPTVYGDPHLGHARPAITFDLVFRYLKHLGYKVRYVRNITDVGHLEHDADEGEDKIAKKARLEQLEPMEIAQYYTNRYHQAMDALGVLRPSIEPHATGHIIEQQQLVQQIIDNGFAYESNGSIYFDIEAYNKKFQYGILSGRSLEKNYADCFTLEGNNSPENMIAWRWVVSSQWTSQNTLQSDLGMTGMDEYGDCWGEWSGATVDLQDAFGFNVLDAPATRPDVDTRRRATMMTVGDVVPYLWRDHGGFDYMRFEFDKEYNPAAYGEHRSATGCNLVKHMYGNNADHVTALGTSAARMASSLCTPILRLADVYLILAEAKVLLGQGTDPDALKAFNAVRQRAIPNVAAETSLTFDKVWKERRLELACEGDRWYDFVRLSYYNPERAISELKSQRRNSYWNLNLMFKEYYKTGQWQLVNKDDDGKDQTATYDDQTPIPNVTINSFTVPFPMEDLTFNPHLKEDAIHVNVRETYSY